MAEHSHTESLDALAGKIDELPLLPQVLVRLLQLSPTADDYFERFESLITEDPSFAVRVIAAANSAASAPVSPITTIRDAMTRMGAGTLSNLVASLSVQRVFMPTRPDQVRLWTHSIAVAVAARMLAGLVPHLSVKPDEAYLAGLLHDVGRFVMLEHASAQLRAVDESHWTSPDELVEADLAIYTFTHAELGYLACRHWGIPDSLSAVVRAHHEPFESAILPSSTDAIRFVVQTADRLCVYVLENTEAAAMADEDLLDRIEAHCLVPVQHAAPLSAETLAGQIEPMRETAARLAAGLGFHYQ